jgi:hypothetical protein
MSTGRFLAMWLLMAVAMTLNGIGRELLLRPLLPDWATALASALLGALWIGMITRWGFAPLHRVEPPANHTTLWRYTALLIGMTVAFETVLGRMVDRKSWAEIAAHYALWRGELWPLLLAWLGATPWVWGRRRTV